MHGWMDGWMDGWTEGWMDGWMDGGMHGWMDGGQSIQIKRTLGDLKYEGLKSKRPFEQLQYLFNSTLGREAGDTVG